MPCRKSSNATHWSCCSDPSGPCRARVSGPQAVWEYDKAARAKKTAENRRKKESAKRSRDNKRGYEAVPFEEE